MTMKKTLHPLVSAATIQESRELIQASRVGQEQTSVRTRPALKVCMFVLGQARNDVRVMREATALTKAGYAVTVVDIEVERGRSSKEVLNGVQIKHLLRTDWYVPTRFKPFFLVKLLIMMLRGTLLLLQTPTDIYHAHDDNALPACACAAFLRRKPLIFDAHELPLSETSITSRHRLHAFASSLLRRIVPHCAGVITVSAPIATEIERHFRARSVRLVRNVPAYQSVPRGDQLRKALHLAPQVRIALYQGGIQPNRRLDMLVRAASHLDPDIVIVLMGSGSAVPQLEQLIEQQGVSERVKVLPPVPYADLLAWSASADIGLIVYAPDYSANVRMCLPNKLFEYLMAGLPILSSQLEAVQELLLTHDAGQVVESLAPEDIGAAINRMLADPEALAHMRRNALAIAQDEYCWEREQHELLQLYDDVLIKKVIPRPGKHPVRVSMHVLGVVRNDMRVLRAATALMEAGYAVTIVDIEFGRKIKAREELRGIQLRHVITPHWQTSRRFKPWFLFEVARLFIRSAVSLASTQTDIYHAHDTTALPACAFAALIRRKPLIFDAHELPLSDLSASWGGLTGLFAQLLTRVVPRCAGVITVSSPIAREIEQQYHCTPVTLVRNVPPYQSVQRGELLRRMPGLPPHARIALYQGRLQADRELDRLIYAAPYLKQGIVIVLMGPADDGIQPWLEELIEREGVGERVKILPPVPYDQLLAWSASADIGLIIYSRQRSGNVRMCLPNKLFEYLMAGLPILASDLDAVREVVCGHDVGQLVDSLEAQEVGEAINRMLADEQGLVRMSHNALAVAKQDLCWEQEQQQLLHLYSEIRGG